MMVMPSPSTIAAATVLVAAACAAPEPAAPTGPMVAVTAALSVSAVGPAGFARVELVVVIGDHQPERRWLGELEMPRSACRPDNADGAIAALACDGAGREAVFRVVTRGDQLVALRRTGAVGSGFAELPDEAFEVVVEIELPAGAMVSGA